MFVNTNPNPDRKIVGDCVVRAISILVSKDWEKIYVDLAIHGLLMHDMPSSNAVWGDYLKSKGYTRDILPHDLPVDYTVNDFCSDRICDKCILCVGLNGGTHVIACIDGDYFDTWDSGNENVIYYWHKKETT